MTSVTVEGFNVRFTKRYWDPNHIETAQCLEFNVVDDQNIYANILTTSKEALNNFMRECASDWYYGNKAYSAPVFAAIKKLYEVKMNDYLTNYYPRLGYSRQLYWHQKDAHSTMLHRRFNLLSFDMGLGKTITSASLSKMMNVSRTIIVCPSIVKWNWLRDLCDDWGYNSMYFSILDARPSKTKKAFIERFVVVNYEMLEKHWDNIISGPCGHIIFDEGHMIKNHKTNRFKNSKKLVDHYKDARVTILSGTPITNRVNDFYSYLLLSGHKLGADYKAFMDSYTVSSSMRGNKVSGSKNLDEFKIRISNFMIRRKTEECIDLPDLIVKNYYIDSDLSEEYEDVVREMSEQADKYEQSNDARERSKIKFAMNQNIHSLNRITALAKVKDVIQAVDNARENGVKTLVFCGYRDPLDALEAHFKSHCVKIDGRVPSHTRDELITRFKNRDDVYVFLGNNKAAGVGINLTNSNFVLMMNYPFTPDDLEQPFKRAHRIGQKSVVNVGIMMIPGSVDEHTRNIIIDKSEDINFIVDGNGKKGVISYGSINDEVFSSVVNQYRRSVGLKEIESKKEFKRNKVSNGTEVIEPA